MVYTNLSRVGGCSEGQHNKYNHSKEGSQSLGVTGDIDHHKEDDTQDKSGIYHP